MNTNEPDFETHLRALHPIAPSPALEENIARQLASHRAIATVEARATVIPRQEVEANAPSLFDRIFPGLRWALAGAATAAAVFLTMNHFQQQHVSPTGPSAAIERDFEAVEVTRDLVAAEDGGVVYEDEEEPARVVRYTTLERHVWTHPITGARLEVEIPREDIVLVPIAMQ